jgi:hypothetical protein
MSNLFSSNILTFELWIPFRQQETTPACRNIGLHGVLRRTQALLRAGTAFGRGGMRHRVTGPSRRMTGNVAPRGVGQGTTGFARGAPFEP